ncbi:TonB-dependent receptor domain-containing protein [Sphingomonas sp.]|uniref:TonB-dependent receptor domain-containing protein n=1 Tax=Sphingomonas sp. TaxID=28214 RepID=UPI003B3B5CFD
MRLSSRIGLEGSLVAIIAAMLAPTGATAQTAAGTGNVTSDQGEVVGRATPTPVVADTTQSDQDIVVTGTVIRGVAPIGSNLVSLGQEAIEKVAPVNVSQIVNTVPSISTAGSVAQGENAYSYYSPQIHSLAGSSSNTTLVLIDGLRLPGGGTQFAQSDPNIIPVSAIQRVEVLADGASSVYGSDAVAGVVNFITRRTYDGININARYGFADNYNVKDVNFIWGTRWDTGGVYVAGGYSDGSNLRNKDRGFASRGDYRDVGGSNNNSFSCNPATIQVTGVSSGATPSGVFLSPGATSTVANNATNAPCNNSVYSTLISAQFRANAMMKVVNDFSDKLSVTAMLNYNYQKTKNPQGPGTFNGAAFSQAAVGTSIAAGVPVLQGQVNPFYTNPTGAPNGTRQAINFLALRDDGDYGTSESDSDSIYATFIADYKLSDNWTLTFSDAFGRNRSSLNNVDTFCSACAMLALNGTTQVSGNYTVTNIAGQNVIATQFPLTVDNAIDVWGVGTGRTSQATLRRLYTNQTSNTNYNNFNQTKLDLQGSLFKLPAGDMKVAVGGEYFWQNQEQKIAGSNNTGPTTNGSNFRVYRYDRTVKSAYAELYIPLVSPEMGIPLANRIDVSISGRYDKYSDVGDTTNPKFAANWEVTPGLKLRGNYSRAFVAPPTAVIGDPTQGYLYASGSVGTQGSINVPVNNYPDVRLIPNAIIQNTNISCAQATAGQVCTLGSGATPSGLRRQLGGGFSNMVPQKGRSWSAGVDFSPRFLPGFVSSFTFFSNKFIGGVSSPSPTAIVNSAGLRDLLTLCPTGCSAEQINTFANVDNGATISGAVPPVVYFLLDQSSRNALNLKVQGIDYQLSYQTEIGSAGRFTFGTSGTYFTKFTQNFGGGTNFSILNTSGYNTTFPSVQFKNRAQLGWSLAGISADLFWNYTGRYRNWSSTSVIPITVDSAGNPTGGGDRVKANNTFDLHLQYEFRDESVLNGWQVYVDVQNLFDKDPPFYNGNTAGILGGAWGYNGFVSNPIGRLISLGLRVNL